jgi:hypothetical protein
MWEKFNETNMGNRPPQKGFSALVLELTQRILAVMLLVASKLSVSVNEAVSVCF